MIFDAPLTAKGLQQAQEAKAKVQELGIQHVITSPFTRALQTASTLFAGTHPIEVRAGHHELLLHSCDVGRHPDALSSDFPDLDFSSLEPRWWYNEGTNSDEIAQEPQHHFKQRIETFVESLEAISPLPIAIVGHGNAFKEIIGTMLENCEIHRYR